MKELEHLKAQLNAVTSLRAWIVDEIAALEAAKVKEWVPKGGKWRISPFGRPLKDDESICEARLYGVERDTESEAIAAAKRMRTFNRLDAWIDEVVNGWIDTKESQPALIDGQDYSANVWGWDGDNIMVVSFFVDSDGWHWANAYGYVFGDAEFDDDYKIKYWQPIAIPLPPNNTKSGL